MNLGQKTLQIRQTEKAVNPLGYLEGVKRGHVFKSGNYMAKLD